MTKHKGILITEAIFASFRLATQALTNRFRNSRNKSQTIYWQRCVKSDCQIGNSTPLLINLRATPMVCCKRQIADAIRKVGLFEMAQKGCCSLVTTV